MPQVATGPKPLGRASSRVTGKTTRDMGKAITGTVLNSSAMQQCRDITEGTVGASARAQLQASCWDSPCAWEGRGPRPAPGGLAPWVSLMHPGSRFKGAFTAPAGLF